MSALAVGRAQHAGPSSCRQPSAFGQGSWRCSRTGGHQRGQGDNLQQTASVAVKHASVPQRVEQKINTRNSIVPVSNLLASVRRCEEDHEPLLPLYVGLSDEVCNACELQPEVARAAFKALKGLGVWAVVVDVWWGQVECAAPGRYGWSRIRAVLKLAQETGLRVKVAFNFHADAAHPLPEWVQSIAAANPDILYTDRSLQRSSECLTLGVDHVPVLHERTAVQAYSQLVAAFAAEFQHLLGSTVLDADVGLGPGGELRYPSTPVIDGRWAFPGVGEFQCYDRYMLASLQACAQQVGQPHWGRRGPHDAGSYHQVPNQSGFFHHRGGWCSEHGAFFLQWYSCSLARHADDVLGAVRHALASAGGQGGQRLRLGARLPLLHWWYNQASHAAEQTAGINNTPVRDGYLQLLQVLQRRGAGVVLCGAELRTRDQPAHALADPEALLRQVRATAAALGLRVTLANAAPGSAAACGAAPAAASPARGAAPAAAAAAAAFDPRSLAELERKAFEPDCCRGIDVGPATALVLHSMGDAMFEPCAWAVFKDWAARVRSRSAALRDSGAAAAAAGPGSAIAAGPSSAVRGADLERGAGGMPAAGPQPTTLAALRAEPAFFV